MNVMVDRDQKSPNKQQIPSVDADWAEIARYAGQFDGYAFWGDIQTSHQQGQTYRQTYEQKGSLPADTDTLKACLFYESRRWRHYGLEPDDQGWAYLHALLAAIQEKERNP